MSRNSNPLPSIQSQYVALSGGIDVTTPSIAKANSEAIIALNVQPHYGGGFSRIEGYECVDGKTAPSSADFYNLWLTEPPEPSLIGRRFTFGNQDCQVIAVEENRLVVTARQPLTGHQGEGFVLSGKSYTLSGEVNQKVGDISAVQRYKAAAFQAAIDWVNAVPGEGDLRGVVELNGNIIAFRDEGDKCGVFLSDNQAGWKTAPPMSVNLTKGKPWQFIYHNFYGGTDTQYAYGTNGAQVIEVHPDGTIASIDVKNSHPLYVCAHRNHLFIAFKGGQLGHSMVGQPTNWSGLMGAEQFGLGDDITALSSSVGGVLLIGCRRKTVALYGNGSADWVLKEVSKVGIVPNTLQSVFAPIAVTSNGITRIDQTEQFGDFRLSEMDANRKLGFNPLTEDIRFSSVKPNANQLRLYGSLRHFCIMLLPDGSSRTTIFTYPGPLRGVWQTPQTVFLAFDDGKLYRQSDNCYSFAGKPIDWLIKTAFNHCGSPTTIKSWKSAELQATTKGAETLTYRYDLDYNAMHHAPVLNTPIQIVGGGGRWNADLWNNFLWSAEDYSTPSFLLSGYSRNIALSFSGSSLYSPQFEISGFILNYIPRRLYRV